MIFFYLSLLMIGYASAAFIADQYSLVLSIEDMSGNFIANATVSVVPNKNTGDLQPMIAFDLRTNGTGYVHLGGRRSPYGGYLSYNHDRQNHYYYGGETGLDGFDFSAKGWLARAHTYKGPLGTYFTVECEHELECPYISSGGDLDTVTSSGNFTLLVGHRGYPVAMNSSTANVFKVLHYSKYASTWQKDSSIYDAPHQYYPHETLDVTNITASSFYRSFTNDSYARYLMNDNAADKTGEMSWICGSGSSLLFAEFKVVHSGNLGVYELCNGGMCPCYNLQDCQIVGRQTGFSSEGYWYSFPQAAMCPPGVNIGVNNCTWRGDYKLNAVIEGQCIQNSKSPFYPNGFDFSSCDDLEKQGDHLVWSLQNCPDVKDTLPYSNKLSFN